MKKGNTIPSISLNESQKDAVKKIEELDAIKTYIGQFNIKKMKEFYDTENQFEKVRIEINNDLNQVANYVLKMLKGLDIDDWIKIGLEQEIKDFYERESVSNQVSYIDKAKYLAKKWRLSDNRGEEWEKFGEINQSEVIKSIDSTFNRIDKEFNKEDFKVLRSEWKVHKSYKLRIWCLWRFCSILRKEISKNNDLLKYIQQGNIKNREQTTKNELIEIISQ